jgi:hypothetical protein
LAVHEKAREANDFAGFFVRLIQAFFVLRMSLSQNRCALLRDML